MATPPKDRGLLVVGGGITGLAIAYIASRSGWDVTVLEGSPTLGGLLNTFPVGGSRLEYYYHHFFTHDAEINWIINDLGIEDHLLFRRTRMGVFREGAIYDFNTPFDLFKFRPIAAADKARFAATSVYLSRWARYEDYEGVAALDWFFRHAGQSTTKSLWEPLLRVKFGSVADQIPLSWMIGRLRQRATSRRRGVEKLGYLDGSLQRLLDSLVGKMSRVSVRFLTDTPMTAIDVVDGVARAVRSGEKRFDADKIVLTIPSIYLADAIREHDADLADRLARIEYLGGVCTVLELSRPLSDIYWLNVAHEGFPFGGVIEHTNFIPADRYRGVHIAYLSRYFTWDEEIGRQNSQKIEETMIAPLTRVFPDFDPNRIEQTHVFKTSTAATVCDLNFSEKIVDCRLPIENLFLANMMHVYPDERSTNNSIRVAAEACR